MLKFKILFIPLLLGIFSGVSATCKLTLTTENLNKHCVIGNDCGASDNGYYLVDNTLLKYTYSENKQSCDTFEIPLPGYYINQKATGNEDKYIQCNSFKSCSFVPAPTEIESCTDENEGQLILGIKNNVQLCTKINYFNKYEGHIELINTGMDLLNYKDSENKRYVIRHSMNNEVFNFDISTTASTYYIVKKDEKSIVFDPKFNNENSGTIVKNACADTSGLILERIYDYCNHKSSGMYYSCLNGKCYARYKTYLEIERPWEYHGCVEVYDDYCSINSEPGKCSSKDNGYYYYQDEEEGTMSIFKFTYDENEPTCEKQYDIFNTRGYYWNGHNYKNVFKCNGQSCQPENVEFNPELDCDGYDNQIIDTGFNLVFCGYNNDNFPKPLYIDEEDFYFIQGRETSGNLFNDPKIFYAIKNSGQSLIIDETINGSTDLDTTLFCTKGECTRQYNNGYYLSNEHSSKLTKCDNNGCAEEKQNANMGYYLNGAALTNEESLTLIKCDKNGCGYANSVPGYYINAANEEVYTIDSSSPSVYEKINIGNCINGDDIGNIFIDNNLRFALCLNFETVIMSAPLNSLVMNYFMKQHSGNIFELESGQFALLRVGENSFTIDTAYNFTNDYYVYINPNTFEVLVEGGCSDGCYDPSEGIIDGSLIKEYKCTNGEPICAVEAVEP